MEYILWVDWKWVGMGIPSYSPQSIAIVGIEGESKRREDMNWRASGDQNVNLWQNNLPGFHKDDLHEDF